ncbi:MAG: NAD-binding protein [Drouetiella hepatica Uher 2000/2452]|jgi:Trk K+ transport system NAD-binding subunit|uniref:NAD-binding protein n=1 Tax=Drouetiella hepatica Uher 2000/2452 TaxID=904376 RepID=A0A951QAH9_9CYAN|nr:NAD-binding protein [Drouetiella hepatica Uher 2000/2452]
MTPTNLAELAKNGDPQAIAALLDRLLAHPETGVKADWQGKQLNLRFFSATEVDPLQTIAFLEENLQVLQIESVETVRVFGYREGEPTPVWSQSVNWQSEAVSAAISAALPPAAPRSIAHSLPPSLPDPQIDRFIVCGLGDLGQYCVLNLKRFALREFEIRVTAIDKQMRDEWEVTDLLNLLTEEPVIGDCRNNEVLLQAGIEQCRAILLVTSNESVNIEAAIAARRLNPNVRLIVRSSRQSLNQLLKQQLGDFVAFDPTELPAASFALAGLQAGILGYFDIGGVRLQVVEQQVQPKDHRFEGAYASTLHKKSYRLLSYQSASGQLPSRAFYQWQTDTQIQPSDTIAYIEVVGQSGRSSPTDISTIETPWQQLLVLIQEASQRSLRRNVTQIWQWLNAQQVRQVIGAGVLFATMLWLTSMTLLWATVPQIGWGKAASTAAILLLGGYGDIFGGLSDPALQVPPLVQLYCLVVTIASLASVLGVLGLITDSLLSSRFDFLRKRPRLPKQNHVVLVGYGRVGQRVAALLKEFRQPVVAITETLEPTVSPTQIPLLVGNPVTELAKVNLANAKSVIVLTEDQMLNLEVALMARDAAQQINRDVQLVVRTYDQRFSDNLSNLLPDAKALAAYGLSAEAFAGAAFGENILGLFRLNEQTILVTEYTIAQGDSLVGQLLAQVSYGYGVVPIFQQRASQQRASQQRASQHKTNQVESDPTDSLMPPDDRRLQVGDRLILLASINGLRRIEHQEASPPQRWRLAAQKPLNQGAEQESSNILHRVSGCDLDRARAFTENLPGTIDLLLYDYQAHRLVEELQRQLPQVSLVPLPL